MIKNRITKVPSQSNVRHGVRWTFAMNSKKSKQKGDLYLIKVLSITLILKKKTGSNIDALSKLY